MTKAVNKYSLDKESKALRRMSASQKLNIDIDEDSDVPVAEQVAPLTRMSRQRDNSPGCALNQSL